MGLVVDHVLRADHNEHVGGDLVQLHASVMGLNLLGVDAQAVSLSDIRTDADWIHVYNLQLPTQTLAAVRAIRRQRPDASIAVSPIFWPIDRASVRAARGEHRMFKSLHAVGPRRRVDWLAARRVLSAADLILPNSHIEAERTQRYFRIAPSPRWRVVHNGIWLRDWPARSQITRRAGPVRVACVARLEPQKNQRRLIEAISLIPGARLTLVGPAGEEQYARSVRDDLARLLGQRGEWLGPLAKTSLAQLLPNFDVHVLPSFRETPGLASMEAAASGCGIVVSREGSTHEYFGDLAQYADPRSTADLAAAVLRAADAPKQPELRALVAGFDWGLISAQLMAAYIDHD